ncbi:hypothetical protein [Paraburkholderia hayleyella]|uniref:hypothetical protein n=1 Tax=Paraburkholderia hayleyella TaxID=2152889 RepID=UPI0012912A75|nr:hypothetical protein [Paraburkholderia hayleyella]
MLATDSVGQKRVASDCCVREKTLPATAGVSGCRVKSNRQRHPEEKKWISEKEAAYAKKYSLTPEQAHNELTLQANLQVQNGSPGTWNQRASDFLSQAHGMLPADGASGPGYMFYATPEQKANVDMYAKYYAGGTGANRPSQSQIGVSVSREQAYRDAFRTGTLVAAGGAATVATGGVIAALPGAPIFSSGGALGTGALASPVGTGAISAGINAGAQYLQGDKINPTDVAGAFVTGAAGSYGGLLWNVGVNSIGGATTTALNNILQGKNDSVVGAGITSGLLSSVGYGAGKFMGNGINSIMKPGINNQNSWVGSGTWSSSGYNIFGPNNNATIGATFGGGAVQEALQNAIQNSQSKGGRK